MTRIVHFSDWHGTTTKLPDADLYICTGDMLPNYLLFKYKDLITNQVHVMTENDEIPPHWWGPIGRMVVPKREAEAQEKWMEMMNGLHSRGYRGLVFGDASLDAPVVCVRGNHDFTDLNPLFGGERYELGDPQRVEEVAGLRIVGLRGISYIRGEWSDETMKPDMLRDADLLPDPSTVDVLVSHSPARGIGDYPQDGVHVGHDGLKSYVYKAMYNENNRLKLHCFGHIHERVGEEIRGNIRFSNAATSYRVIDL